jgi:excisionase family DNA binding protein
VIPLAVSVSEAGRLLGISRSTAYAAVKRGDIPSVRIGGRVLVPLRRLEELIDPRDER